MTQKDIYDYLLANDLGFEVNVGALDDLNGLDYFFLNYIGEDLIGYDNRGAYRTEIQITVASRDFEKMRRGVQYIKDKFNVSIYYNKSAEFEYYTADCTFSIILHG